MFLELRNLCLVFTATQAVIEDIFGRMDASLKSTVIEDTGRIEENCYRICHAGSWWRCREAPRVCPTDTTGKRWR